MITINYETSWVAKCTSGYYFYHNLNISEFPITRFGKKDALKIPLKGVFGS